MVFTKLRREIDWFVWHEIAMTFKIATRHRAPFVTCFGFGRVLISTSQREGGPTGILWGG